MKPCSERVVECFSAPNPCKFHEECTWCGKFHFVKEDPITPDPPGTYGSQQGLHDWPPRGGLNMACAGRPKTVSREGSV